MRRLVPLIGIFIAIAPAPAKTYAGQPEDAKTILESAVKQAEASHRTVFLIFHASWCRWCTRLDVVLETPDVKKIIEEHYVVVHLDVQERGDKIRTLENPGGEEIMNAMGGKDTGLPFYAFIDGAGKKIADSKVVGPSKENIGYPGSADEVSQFDRLLKQTAPRMTDEQRATVMRHFPAEGT
jgi:thioredoxin-related protein